MPGSRKEVLNATEEGAEFEFLASPKGMNFEEGAVKSVRFVKMALGEADANGRQRVEEITGSEFDMEADIVIKALGFSHQTMDYAEGFELNKWGGFVVNENYQTSDEKVWAGGDCVRGADLAVTAAYDGRTAAYSIAKTLLGEV